MRWTPILLAALACQRAAPVDDARSEGMSVIARPVVIHARIFEAAARAAFDFGPGLVLLLDPTHLPPGSGYEGGPPVPDSLRDALIAAGVVAGTCTPKRESDQRAPTCAADRSGYVLRASELFGGAGDTVQMYLASEVYASSKGPGQQPFAFEMAYKLVPGSGGRWRVVAEGRVRGTKQ